MANAQNLIQAIIGSDIGKKFGDIDKGIESLNTKLEQTNKVLAEVSNTAGEMKSTMLAGFGGMITAISEGTNKLADAMSKLKASAKGAGDSAGETANRMGTLLDRLYRQKLQYEQQIEGIKLKRDVSEYSGSADGKKLNPAIDTYKKKVEELEAQILKVSMCMKDLGAAAREAYKADYAVMMYDANMKWEKSINGIIQKNQKLAESQKKLASEKNMGMPGTGVNPKSIDDYKTAFKNLQNAINSAELGSSTFKTLQERLSGLQQEFANLTGITSKAETDVRSRLESLQQKAYNIREQIGKLNMETQDQFGKKGTYNPKIDEAIKSYKGQLAEVEAETERIRKKYGQLANEVDKAWEPKRLEQQIRLQEKLGDAVRKNWKNYEMGNLGVVKNFDPKTVEEYQIAIKNLKKAIKDVQIGGTKEQQKAGIKNISEMNKQISKYEAKLRQVGAIQDNINSSSMRLGTILKNIGASMGIFFSVQSIMNFARGIANVTGEFEIQRRSMQNIIGDYAAADKIFGKTVKLAIRSPYTVKELIGYTKQLSAYRIETEKLYDTTKMLADISSGLGVDMNRLILAYGQVKAANYLRGQELRQFSEAGVNILGGLSDYFTEMKGQAVSTAKVFDMVSKRMVSFEDVSNVLQKLTEKGGAFYRMQEVQAETLAGKMANLKDRYELMLNEIGEKNRGFISGIVDSLSNLVENYEKAGDAVIILTSALVAYRSAAIAASVTTTGSLAAGLAKVSSMGGGLAMLAKRLGGVTAALGTIASSPIGWIAAAIVAIGGAAIVTTRKIRRHNEEIENARKEYDILRESIETQSFNEYDEWISRIESNNRTIIENAKALDKLGSSIDDVNKRKLNLQESEEAMQSNIDMVRQLKREFALFGDQIDITENGVVKFLGETAEMYNRKRAVVDMANAMNLGAGGKNDMVKIVDDFDDVQRAIDKTTNELEAAAGMWLSAVKLNIEGDKDLAQSKKDLFNSIMHETYIDEKGIEREIGIIEKYKKVTETVRKPNGRGGWMDEHKLFGFGYGDEKLGREALRLYQKLITEMKERNKLEEKFSVTLSETYENMNILNDNEYDIATENGKTMMTHAINGMLYEWRDKVPQLRDAIGESMKELFNIEIGTPESIEYTRMNRWQKAIDDYIQDYNRKVEDSSDLEHRNKIQIKISPELEEGDLKKQVTDMFDAYEAKLKTFYNKDNTRNYVQVSVSEAEANTAAEMEIALQHIADLLGMGDLKDRKNRGGSKNPALERLNKQIDAVKSLNSAYEKYIKLYSQKDAIEKTREDFDGLLKELGMIDWANSMVDGFGDRQVVNAFRTKFLSPMVAAAGKDGAIAEKKFESEFGIGIAEYDFGQLKDRIQKAFDEGMEEFSLSDGIRKLGINDTLARTLFGVEPKTLDGIRNDIRSIFDPSEFRDSSEMKDFIDDLEAKIMKKEDEARKENLKKYVKYFSQTMNERVKIEYDGLREIDDINRTFEAEIAKARSKGDEVRARELASRQQEAIKGSMEATQKALDEQQWKDFQGTEMYIRMFEDMDHQTSAVIDTMLARLEDLKGSLGGLSPASVRAIVKEMDKLKQEKFERNPFSSMLETMKKVREMRARGDTYEALSMKYTESSTNLKNLQDELDLQNLLLKAKEDMKDGDSQIVTIGKKQYDLSEKTVDSIRMQVQLKERQVALEKQNVEHAKEGLDTYSDLSMEADEASKKWKEKIGSIKEIYSDINEMLEVTGNLVTEEAKAWADAGSNAIDLIGKIGEMIVLTKTLKDSDPLGWVALAVDALTFLVTSFANIKNARIDDTMETLQKRVDALATSAERMQAAFDRAWDVQRMRSYTEQIESSMRQQIRSYNAMISAEKERKNPDDKQIAEWENTIYELGQSVAEARENFITELGGIGESEYKSAAQQFVDAWYDAYRETGNGLTGLEDTFNEFFENMTKKQAMARIAQRFLEPVFTMIDDSIGNDGVLDIGEIERIRREWESQGGMLNDALKNFFDALGLSIGDTGSLSGLTEGIQGVTESTAQIIEGYLNSMRYYSQLNASNSSSMLAIMQDATGTVNPMLGELRMMRQRTDDIYAFLNTRRENGTDSMRVFVVNP